MANKLKDIINLAKSIAPTLQDPVETIELGNGYLLIHTHSEVPSVSDRGNGYAEVQYYEVRHPAFEHVIASLTGMYGKDIEPIVKIGYILKDHKSPGMAKNVSEALTKKYGSVPAEVASFLQTAWGNEEAAPSVDKQKTGDWGKVHDLLDAFVTTRSLSKSMMVKVKGHKGWHEVKDVVDTKKPSHLPDGGNHYVFTHGKTGETMSAHQSDVLDLADASELKEISYKRKFGKPENMEKGAPQRLFPFNPAKDVPSHERQAVQTWTNEPGGSRERVPEMSPTVKNRAIHRMAGRALHRKNPTTGETEFLMHRGAGPGEIDSNNREGKYSPNRLTSWTPDLETAKKFVDDYKGHMVSAWIPASQFHHVPKMIGETQNTYGWKPPKNNPKNLGPQKYRYEEEVIVKPGDYEHGTAEDVARAPLPGWSRRSPEELPISQRLEAQQSREQKRNELTQYHVTRGVEKSLHTVIDSLQKSTPGLAMNGASGVAAIAKTDPDRVISNTLAKTEPSPAMNALLTQAQSVQDPESGETLYLMFSCTLDDGAISEDFVSPQADSLWTPFPGVAVRQGSPEKLVAAWIPAKNIQDARNPEESVFYVSPSSFERLDNKHVLLILEKITGASNA